MLSQCNGQLGLLFMLSQCNGQLGLLFMSSQPNDNHVLSIYIVETDIYCLCVWVITRRTEVYVPFKEWYCIIVLLD
jgi:hypothetical protein